MIFAVYFHQGVCIDSNYSILGFSISFLLSFWTCKISRTVLQVCNAKMKIKGLTAVFDVSLIAILPTPKKQKLFPKLYLNNFYSYLLIMFTKYDSGATAIDLKEDGTGFLYYPNGSIAISCSQATDYQNSYYVFDKDRGGSLLFGLDEMGVGFCTCSKRKSAESDGSSLVFTTKGGVLANSQGTIVNDWKWDRESLEKGNEPTDTVIMHLNENVTFKYKDRSNMSLEFQCENARHVIDTRVRVRRTTNYITNAKKGLAGRLIPQIENVTLKDRQCAFSESMRAQKNKLHPKSENLSSMVRDIVAKLEEKFDHIDKTLATSPTLDPAWKTSALENTIREIPRLPVCGAETGVFSGFGTHIYVPPEEFDMSLTLPAHMKTAKGVPLNELELRNTIMEMNPPLKRSSMLRAASGRYSSMLMVNKNAATSTNPTGMVEPVGIPLEKVRWNSFKQELMSQVGQKGPLVTALLTRAGDPVCCTYMRIAEAVNRDILLGLGAYKSDSSSLDDIKAKALSASFAATDSTRDMVTPRTSGMKMVRIEVSEEYDAMTDMGVKTVPAFVMFSQGNIVYAGPLGGRKVKSKGASVRPQILIVEPNPADQIKAEKTLRKLGCDTFLCINAHQAIDRVNQMCLGRGGDNDAPCTIFDMVLISESIQTSDVLTLATRLEDFTKMKRTLICALVSVLGKSGGEHLRAVQWNHSTTEGNLSPILDAPLSNITTYAMQKPIKANAVEMLLGKRVIPHDGENGQNMGLTEKALYTKMTTLQNEISNGGGRRTQPLTFTSSRSNMGGGTSSQGTYIGICLSAEDVKMKGRQLVASTGKSYT